MSEVRMYQPRNVVFSADQNFEAIRYTGENHFAVQEFVGPVEDAEGRVVNAFGVSRRSRFNTLPRTLMLYDVWFHNWATVKVGDMIAKHSDGTVHAIDGDDFDKTFVVYGVCRGERRLCENIEPETTEVEADGLHGTWVRLDAFKVIYEHPDGTYYFLPKEFVPKE